jgi:transposase
LRQSRIACTISRPRFDRFGPRRSPAVAVAAILSLARGIGANSAIFSLADSVMPVPSEYSSGASRHRRGITKAGNPHLRRILVEPARH